MERSEPWGRAGPTATYPASCCLLSGFRGPGVPSLPAAASCPAVSSGISMWLAYLWGTIQRTAGMGSGDGK